MLPREESRSIYCKCFRGTAGYSREDANGYSVSRKRDGAKRRRIDSMKLNQRKAAVRNGSLVRPKPRRPPNVQSPKSLPWQSYLSGVCLASPFFRPASHVGESNQDRFREWREEEAGGELGKGFLHASFGRASERTPGSSCHPGARAQPTIHS